MSKTAKRKISVELQQKPSSKSRLSVFERLGTKKSKSILKSLDLKSLTDDFKQTLSAAVNIKPSLSINKPDVELDDADPDLLEKKRQELQKELELQMKMESRRTATTRKRKRAPSSSESSSSSSESESSSSTSSSSSSDDRHKGRKVKSKHHDSSTSSDEYAKKVAKKKRSCQNKKDALKIHKISKKHELASISRKIKRHSTSPLTKKHRSDSSATLMMNPSGQKVMVKNLKVSTTVEKHHRIKEAERAEMLQRELKERERERIRMREERIHDSRSPKLRRSRSPKREFLRRSPIMKRSQSPKSSRSMSRRIESCERERERRDKDRDSAREKERRDALLRCQERQRERDRAAKDVKNQRLLPRPAERAAMALAAAQERRSAEKDHVPYVGRGYAERTESFDHRRHVKDGREHYRPYENRREPNDYQHSGSYRREWNEPAAKERDWHEENSTKDVYDRHQTTREWDHKRNDNIRPTTENYPERKDWSESNAKWESRKNSSWQQEADTSWSNRYKEENWQDSNQQTPPVHHNRAINEKIVEHAAPSAVSKPIQSSLGRRWNTWRGRGRGSHHGDFRRAHHHTEILEERGEIYRRHINPQGANATKPVARKSIDSQPQINSDKTNDEPSKGSNQDENAEEIADDLSEISDEADEFLGQQEESQPKSQPIEKMDETLTTDGSELNQSIQGPQKESNATEIEKSHKEEEKATVQEQFNEKAPEENDRSKDLSEDIDLDFEEISDGELEEEARIKGLGDALGVDWASLVEESKAILQEKLSKTETSAKQRWNPNQILLDTGISYKMAGKAFAQQFLLRVYEKEDTQKVADVKIEITDEDRMEIDIKKETEEIEPKINGKHAGEETENVPRIHPLPCIQVSALNWSQKQHRLVFNASGPYSRGLCTKRDLAMRRQLCQLAVNETNCKSVNIKNNSGYENIAMKLFQKALQA